MGTFKWLLFLYVLACSGRFTRSYVPHHIVVLNVHDDDAKEKSLPKTSKNVNNAPLETSNAQQPQIPNIRVRNSCF